MKSRFLALSALTLVLGFVAPMSCFAEELSSSPNKTSALFSSQPAAAKPNASILIPNAPELNATGYVLMDANSGRVIASKNPDTPMPPASLTKMMTLYVAFQALKNGQIHMTDLVHISTEAWQSKGSLMFVKVGTDVPVEELIKGIIIASGNDACVALAEYIGGTETTFAQLMNKTAQQLGMKHSHFVDSTGMPNPDHYSSPRDMAILARALIRDFPQYYGFFKEKWITYNNIKQPNRNRLLWRDPSVDGLKTGHTDDAGFCLVASSVRDQMRLIASVMGTPSDSARATDTEALLNYGFRFYKTYALLPATRPLTQQRVSLGQRKTVSLGLEKPLYVTIPFGQYSGLRATLNIDPHLKAPIQKGQKCGTVVVTLNNKALVTAPIVAYEANPLGGFFSRTWDHMTSMFGG